MSQVSSPIPPAVVPDMAAVHEHLVHAREGLHACMLAALAIGSLEPALYVAACEAEELVDRAQQRLSESGSMAPRKNAPKERLRLHRRLRGWSQEDVVAGLHRLAASLDEPEPGVNATMVSRWERGVRRPRPRYVRLLCRLFELPVEQLGLIEDVARRGLGRAGWAAACEAEELIQRAQQRIEALR
jgi:transcriptional regulator with XRE-family HTH domain